MKNQAHFDICYYLRGNVFLKNTVDLQVTNWANFVTHGHGFSKTINPAVSISFSFPIKIQSIRAC